MLYVFVDIKIDTAHFIDTVKYNFAPGSKLAFVSTIQFVAALQVCLKLLISGVFKVELLGEFRHYVDSIRITSIFRHEIQL